MAAGGRERGQVNSKGSREERSLGAVAERRQNNL